MKYLIIGELDIEDKTDAASIERELGDLIYETDYTINEAKLKVIDERADISGGAKFKVCLVASPPMSEVGAEGTKTFDLLEGKVEL